MTVPAAAASGVSPLIAGVRSTGVVIGSFSQALIIGFETADGPRVLSLLGPLAAGVPHGVRVPGGAVEFARHRPGEKATVGHGAVTVAGLHLRVVRTWNSRAHRITPGRAGIEHIVAVLKQTERGVPLAAIDTLNRVLESEARVIRPAVEALVGLGTGLTPGGDDVLAGLLVGLHAAGLVSVAGRIADHALDRIDDRTTQLSADLLRLASAGHACVEALELLRAVHTGRQVPAALDRLLSIGHTSGADLATGLGMGLEMGLRCGRNMSQGSMCRYGEVSTTTR